MAQAKTDISAARSIFGAVARNKPDPLTLTQAIEKMITALESLEKENEAMAKVIEELKPGWRRP